MSRRKRAKRDDPRYETVCLDGTLTAEQKNRVRPSWNGRCENCGQGPIVPLTGLCGPCTFGEADTAFGGWWDFDTDEPTDKESTSSSEHTPGPWEWHREVPHGGGQVKATNVRHGYICTVSGNVSGDTPLIASAPDMLAALKMVLRDIDRGLLGLPQRLNDDGDPCVDDERYPQFIRAAIAKATGEAG